MGRRRARRRGRIRFSATAFQCPAATTAQRAVPAARRLGLQCPAAAMVRRAVPAARRLGLQCPAAAMVRRAVPAARRLGLQCPAATMVRRAVPAARRLGLQCPAATMVRRAVPAARCLGSRRGGQRGDGRVDLRRAGQRLRRQGRVTVRPDPAQIGARRRRLRRAARAKDQHAQGDDPHPPKSRPRKRGVVHGEAFSLAGTVAAGWGFVFVSPAGLGINSAGAA